MARRDYLGTGFTFPLQINVQGGIHLSSDHEDVRQAIWIILGTEQGERVYRPNFGCRLNELTFTPLNTRTLFLIKMYVQEALEMWEPRIELDEVMTEADPILGRVDIRIDYRLKRTHEVGSLVYPFYLMAREA